jgi:hypothetical protein
LGCSSRPPEPVQASTRGQSDCVVNAYEPRRTRSVQALNPRSRATAVQQVQPDAVQRSNTEARPGRGLRAREPLEAPPAEPVAECLRIARRHRHDRAYLDRPVRGGPIERAVSTLVPAPAACGHPGYPKARVRKPVPPGKLFPGWLAVAHSLAHVARLRSQSVRHTG